MIEDDLRLIRKMNRTEQLRPMTKRWKNSVEMIIMIMTGCGGTMVRCNVRFVALLSKMQRPILYKVFMFFLSFLFRCDYKRDIDDGYPYYYDEQSGEYRYFDHTAYIGAFAVPGIERANNSRPQDQPDEQQRDSSFVILSAELAPGREAPTDCTTVDAKPVDQAGDGGSVKSCDVKVISIVLLVTILAAIIAISIVAAIEPSLLRVVSPYNATSCSNNETFPFDKAPWVLKSVSKRIRYCFLPLLHGTWDVIHLQFLLETLINQLFFYPL